jgi:hypothetical protein
MRNRQKNEHFRAGDAPFFEPEGVRERRHWVRHAIPDLMTQVSWPRAEGLSLHPACLLDISAQGAAILVDKSLLEDQPMGDPPLVVHFKHHGVSRRPISAEIVHVYPHGSERLVLQVRFRDIAETRGAVGHRRERRIWRRLIPREKRVMLNWECDDSEYSVAGMLVNISMGGAAVRTEAGLTENGPIWLSIGTEAQPAEAMECRLVGIHHDPWGRRLVQLSFKDACVARVLEAALGLAEPAIAPGR